MDAVGSIALIIFIVIINAILSWLIAFDVLNVRNQTVYRIARALDAMTDPLLRPIRRFMPDLGGVDISPIVLVLIIYLVQQIIVYYLYPLAG